MTVSTTVVGCLRDFFDLLTCYVTRTCDVILPVGCLQALAICLTTDYVLWFREHLVVRSEKF